MHNISLKNEESVDNARTQIKRQEEKGITYAHEIFKVYSVAVLSPIKPTGTLDAANRLHSVSRKPISRFDRLTFSLMRCLQYLHFFVCLMMGSDEASCHKCASP